MHMSQFKLSLSSAFELQTLVLIEDLKYLNSVLTYMYLTKMDAKGQDQVVDYWCWESFL